MEQRGVILEVGVRSGLLITQHRINHLEVIERLFHLFLCSEWNLRPTLDVPQRQNFIWIAPFIPAEVEGQLKVLCSATWPHKMPHFYISTLIKQHTHEIHLPSADGWKVDLFFENEMKFGCVATAGSENLSGVNKQPFNITQTQLRIIAASVWQTLLGSLSAPCNSWSKHIPSWCCESRFCYGLFPSAPITAHALRQQVLRWKMAHFA